MVYAGLFNSSYVPSPLELLFLRTPQDQLGPVVTGEILVTLLQGVLLVQYYKYIREFWGEKRWTKWLVHSTFILCLVKFAYVWWLTWDRFVSHYGDYAYLATFSPIAVPIGISSTLPSAVCQVFYIHRCWALSHTWFFLVPAVSSLLLTVGSGIALTWGSALAAGGDVKITNMILFSINISLASGLVCDLFITTFTCYYLIREKTGFKETDGLVSRLVKCSIESAAGPTVVALINLVLSNRAVNNQWFLVPNLALSHVYACSLLYTFNARRTVGMRTPMTTGTHGTTNPAVRTPTAPRSKSATRNYDYPMQERAQAAKIPEVYIDVQTVRHQESVIDNRQAMEMESGEKRLSPDDDSSFHATSRGTTQWAHYGV